MRLVNDEIRPVFAGQLSQRFVITRVGVNDADIGHGRLGEDGGNFARGERDFEQADVVELDHLGGFTRVNLRTHVVGTRDGRAFFIERDEGFIHRAVIAIVEDENFRATCDHARHAQRETIRVSSGEGELPVWKFETTLKFFADPNHIFIRQHERDAFLNLLVDGFHSGVGAVTRHRACVAEAKINVVVAIHIGEVCAFCLFDKNRERPCPADHPQHRHATVQRLTRALV